MPVLSSFPVYMSHSLSGLICASVHVPPAGILCILCLFMAIKPVSIRVNPWLNKEAGYQSKQP